LFDGGVGQLAERDDALSVSLAHDPYAPFEEGDILATEEQDLPRSQTAQEHQMDDGDIPITPLVRQKLADLLPAERRNQSPRHLHLELERVLLLETVQTESSVSARSLVKRRREARPSAGVQTPGKPKLEEQPAHGQTTVDGARLGPSLLFVSHEFQ
jgi:hypothetical protein